MVFKKRYLTKSLFNTSRECASRLYYAKRDEYPSVKDEDEFLQSLAEGGMQVGELACMMHPGGVAIETLNSADAIAQTDLELQKDCVRLYEPAITYDDKFLIRVDVFEKYGNDVNLIEVKAKSWNPDEEFFTQSGTIRSEWTSYLFDVAFQYWVMNRAHPDWNVTPYLMLVNKDAVTTVDGLYQRFRVVENENGRKEIKLKPGTTLADLGEPILKKVDVSEAVATILAGKAIPEAKKTPLQQLDFSQWMHTLADYHIRNEQYPVEIGDKCRSCEFRVPLEKLKDGQHSGFGSCWKIALGWDDDDFQEPHIFDLWNGRSFYSNMVEKGIYHLKDVRRENLPANPDGITSKLDAWDSKERQTVQIQIETGGISEDEVILNPLYEEMSRWQYPLHFLDFEALRLAIPFLKGRRPYEQLAFQFSVHTMQEDGTVTHSAEWIDRERGSFPNYECVRQLKSVLDNDKGTIFQYTHFENTLLTEVMNQLTDDRDQVKDADELIEWIQTIIRGGEREMVDLHKLIKQYHYHKDFKGSISIKKVLPAILNTSESLKDKYSQPYQGKNFNGQIWYQENEEGTAIDPYKLLPPISFENLPDYETGEEFIADGGSAMMAYARMQFDDVPQEERDAVFNALLSYCELDTLAMVMVIEAWKGAFE
ncbi:DUF2779 domain-containing protein [Rhodohalobacter sp.]|uniref:DUF2779 domain-containing protein n=1 Tax=Rhodohalobacter sp. TaxID=1974210 RepID=UPI003568435B